MSSYVYSSILDDANSFRYTVLNIKKIKGRKCLIPYIVNSSFALELYLKSILMANKIHCENNHHLTELFELLPDNIKEEFSRSYNNLDELLSKYDNAFMKFRYHYELYDTKTGKEKEETILSFNTEEIESLLLLFYSYCNSKYSNIDFVQMQIDINKEVNNK